MLRDIFPIAGIVLQFIGVTLLIGFRASPHVNGLSGLIVQRTDTSNLHSEEDARRVWRKRGDALVIYGVTLELVSYWIKS